MKLLLCRNCGDVFSLSKNTKSCSCGETKGRYIDNLNAWYSGIDALPLGFANNSFITAINNQPDSGWGKSFEAFVIEKDCETFKLKSYDRTTNKE